MSIVRTACLSGRARFLFVALAIAGCESGEGDPCQLDFDCASGLVCSGSPRGVCIDSANAESEDESADATDAGMAGDDDAGTTGG